tara:strand:- start:18287 stop:18475 length:189 start_codon:yes stop_codon:yes gene_type:complete
MTLEEAIEIHGIWFSRSGIAREAVEAIGEEAEAAMYIAENWDEYYKEALVRKARVFASRGKY